MSKTRRNETTDRSHRPTSDHLDLADFNEAVAEALSTFGVLMTGPTGIVVGSKSMSDAEFFAPLFQVAA